MLNYYLRRCKYRIGSETHERLHISPDMDKTLCGKTINVMWWLESSSDFEPEDVTCPKCRSVAKRKGLISDD